MRQVVRTVLLGLCLLTSLSTTGQAAVPASLPPLGLDQLVGEHLVYAIDFMVFKRIAAGELTLRPTDEAGIYEAELIGRTLGVAAWLTGDRTQHYRTRMRWDEDGRLHSLVHESQIDKRKRGEWRHSGKRFTFAADHRQVIQEKSKDGVFIPGKVFELPAGEPPADILTAFYNLRLGVYGEIVPGRKILIPTFTSKGLREIVVDVLTVAERAPYRFFPNSGWLLRCRIDPEVFGTSRGELFIWFDEAGVPARGIIEDVIGLGDVRGYQEETAP
ncbi:MAG: DUF3108 domain-containing protein [Desulfuromonadales bacterium]|nr:DUF3108 domain-containing protein [Desulfuromonadales bacterium]